MFRSILNALRTRRNRPKPRSNLYVDPAKSIALCLIGDRGETMRFGFVDQDSGKHVTVHIPKSQWRPLARAISQQAGFQELQDRRQLELASKAQVQDYDTLLSKLRNTGGA